MSKKLKFAHHFFILAGWVLLLISCQSVVGGGLIGYVKSKPFGNGQIISIDVLVFVMIIAIFHEKLI